MVIRQFMLFSVIYSSVCKWDRILNSQWLASNSGTPRRQILAALALASKMLFSNTFFAFYAVSATRENVWNIINWKPDSLIFDSRIQWIDTSELHHGLRGSARPVLTATDLVSGKWQILTRYRIDNP